MPAMRFKGDNVEFDMYVQNPNPDQLTVNAIVGDMYMAYKGKVLKIGNVFKYGDVIIKPLQETKFTFSVRLKFLPLLIYFQDLLAGKATGQILTFKGTITVDRMPWPIKESLKIS
jgi:LEA14-like dessication related protein